VEEMVSRFVDNFVDRLTGPLQFRLYVQPAVAILYAIRDGLRDARAGNVPYFWAIFTQPAHRRELLHEGWKAVANVFVLAVIIDVIYQLIVLRFVYPGEAMLVAFVLAFLPYLLLRGPVNRVARVARRK
jgi:hypothetical protein